MEVPYLPGHFYVNIPSDGEKGGQPQVTYMEKMPLGLDRKYPFFAVFKLPEVGLYKYKYCWCNPEKSPPDAKSNRPAPTICLMMDSYAGEGGRG